MYGPFLVLYDNGNTRVEGPDGIGGNSRGQVWLLNELWKTAILVHNFDLGEYAFALGSAQLLANGNYHFLNGFINSPDGPFGRSLEVTPEGAISFGFRSEGATYRSFRMVDLYRP